MKICQFTMLWPVCFCAPWPFYLLSATLRKVCSTPTPWPCEGQSPNTPLHTLFVLVILTQGLGFLFVQFWTESDVGLGKSLNAYYLLCSLKHYGIVNDLQACCADGVSLCASLLL